MSTRQDLEDARELFLNELRGDPATASRIADIIERVYVLRALQQPREVVLDAALWAAGKLRDFPDTELRRIGEREIVSVLNTSDCPLCIGDGGKSGTGSGSPTTARPPRVPVVPPSVPA